ncbi:MAG: hypothetical protein V1897_05350 [Pseudomonadota bacterium]
MQINEYVRCLSELEEGGFSLGTKQKQPTWSDVKSKIVNLSEQQLVQIVGELYRLSKENKEFLNVRFDVLDDPLAPFKKSIEDALCPDVLGDKPIQIARAKEAIRRYYKAAGDLTGEAKLKTFFVECGNRYTLDYGDMYEEFYDAVNLMYREAIYAILTLPQEQRGNFKARLRIIMESAKDIGWGYYDELREDYYEAFPEDG